MRDKRYKSVKKTLWIILFANVLVAVIKICIGICCESQSVIADGIHSFADGASNAVGLIGIWLAAKPCDKKHQYGHGKYEIVASLFIGLMLGFMSIRIISGAVKSFETPATLSIDYVECILIIFTIIVNAFVAYTEFKHGKKLKSTILITDSLHTRGDILISCTVLLGLICIKAGIPAWVDGVMSILVAVAVLISAWQIIKNCIDVLVDSTVVDGEEVKKLLMTIPGIYDIHQVRSRGELSHTFIDFHVVVNPQENVECMHILSHDLEAILKEHFGEGTEVSIHLEPKN